MMQAVQHSGMPSPSNRTGRVAWAHAASSSHMLVMEHRISLIIIHVVAGHNKLRDAIAEACTH